MNLYDHQRKALELIQEYDKGIFNLTCGSGKTLIMKEASKLYKISAIFAPTKNLVSQIYEEYFKINGIVINSDNSPDYNVIRRNIETSDHIVFVCNYQSLHVLGDICTHFNMTYDIVMFDEAHNVTSTKRRDQLNSINSEINNPSDTDSEINSKFNDIDSDTLYKIDSIEIKKLIAKKIFFFTATPTKIMKESPEIYGPELLHISFADGVVKHLVKNIDTVIECYASNDTSCLDVSYNRLISSINRFINAGKFKRVINSR